MTRHHSDNLVADAMARLHAALSETERELGPAAAARSAAIVASTALFQRDGYLEKAGEAVRG